MLKVKGAPTVIICLFVLVLMQVQLSSLFAQPVDLTTAKKEGKVIVYGTVVPQVMAEINKAFEKKYGIRVKYWRGSATEILDRATNEWNAGRPGFDVLEAAGAVHFVLNHNQNSYNLRSARTKRWSNVVSFSTMLPRASP